MIVCIPLFFKIFSINIMFKFICQICQIDELIQASFDEVKVSLIQIHEEVTSAEDESWSELFEGVGTMISAFMLPTWFGAADGGAIGCVAGRDERLFIEEMSEAQLQAALRKLRRNARIPDYK